MVSGSRKGETFLSLILKKDSFPRELELELYEFLEMELNPLAVLAGISALSIDRHLIFKDKISSK
jgi:hypothetical protein